MTGNTPAVHQFCPSWSPGDPVAESADLVRRLLRDLGFQSTIYAERRAGPVESLARYDPSPDNLLLIHHLDGHDQLEWLLGLPDRKVLFIHPAPASGPATGLQQVGRRQLGMLRQAVELAVAPSPHCASELRDLGYTVRLMSPAIDLAQIRSRSWTPVPAPITGPAPLTLLFVDPARDSAAGLARIASAARRRWDGAVRAVVATPSTALQDELRAEAAALGVADVLHVLRPPARAELYGWYRAATALLRTGAAEHSAVPLIEAMALDVPVVALGTESNRAALGGAGVLVKEPDLDTFASVAVLLAEDRALRRAVVETQRARLASLTTDRLQAELSGLLSELGLERQATPAKAPAPAARPRVQIEGPFETSYSLAAVNRELALALERRSPGSVALFATEGPGDFQPDQESMKQHPGLADLWRRGVKGSQAPVVVRNLYPPRVADMDGALNLLYFAWEESSVPAQWVDGFNLHLDGLCVLSRFVKKALLDSGVWVPISVGGCGLEQVTRAGRAPYPGHLEKKKFRFLHVSSCFPRKGIDVLLRAYTREFTASDDVSLVIKTFPNPHHRIGEQVAAARARPGCPEIVLIEDDLPPGQVADLYQRCHAFAAPSRGEGFGLPMAEAMHFGLPVIVTGFGGHMDFCSEETAWLVGYTFARAQTHFGQHSSVWAEPDEGQLARAMRQVLEQPEEAGRRARRAKEKVDRELSWAKCAGRLEDAVTALGAVRPLEPRRLRVGWVSSWNTRCGIASYSRYLVDRLAPGADLHIFAARTDAPTAPDEPNVTRCWDDSSRGLGELEAALRRHSLDVVVFQFSYAFFNLQALSGVLEQLRARGVTVVIAFHATRDVDEPGWRVSLREIASQLARVDRLLVHTVADLNRLKELGLVENAALVPQGVLRHAPREPRALRATLGLPLDAEIVASYGFLLPHKGIEELVTAFATVARERPRAHLFLVNARYPRAVSDEVAARVVELVRRHGLERRLTRIDDYLQDAESLTLLECADLVVFPYQRTGESSSAAVRFGLGSNRPVACTPLEIFSDVARVVHSFAGTTPGDIARGLHTLLSDPPALHATGAAQQAWLEEHDWDRVARRVQGILRGLVRDAQAPAPEIHPPRRGEPHA